MALTSNNSAGLLFRIKGDSTDAVKAIKDVQQETETLVVANKGAASSLTGIVNPATLATAALASVAAASAAAVAALFQLGLSAAKYGAAIQDASTRTGLSATAISALKFAAEQGGSSLDKIADSVAQFNARLGEARQGKAESIKVLERFGITTLDTDEALRQAIDSIQKMETADQRAAAAKQLFGDEAGKILPVLLGMNGGLDGSIKRIKELGIVIDDEAAVSAKRLDGAMTDLGAALRGIGLQIGNELVPHIERLVSGLVNWIVRNQALIRNIAELAGVWMQRFVNALLAVARGVEVVAGGIQRLSANWSGFTQAVINSIPALRLWLAVLDRIYAAAGRIAGEGSPLEGGGFAGTGASTGVPRLPGGGGGRARGGGGSNDAEQKRRQELQAQLDLERLFLQRLEDQYKDTIDKLMDDFKRTGDDMALAEGVNAAIQEISGQYEQLFENIRQKEEELYKDRTASEKELARERRNDRRKDFEETVNDLKNKAQEALNKFDEQIAEKTKQIFDKLKDDARRVLDDLDDELIAANIRFTEKAIADAERIVNNPAVSREIRAKAADDLLASIAALAEYLEQTATLQRNRTLEYLEEEKRAREKLINDTIRDEQKRQIALEELDLLYKNKALLAEEEFQRRLREIKDRAGATAAGADLGAGLGGRSQFQQLFDQFEGNEAAIAGIEAVQQAFEGLGQAVGSAVQAFVLYGNAGTSVRKVTAQILASIAQQAAVKAVFQLAEGFAALARAFFGDPKAAAEAAMHFKSAAIYGSIAGIAAVAGRGVAGNEFNQQAGAATGGAVQPADQRENFGGRFSGFGANGQQQGGFFAPLMERLNVTLGAMQQTTDNLATRLEGISASEVVRLGAGDAAGEIRQAVESELGSDLRAAEGLTRGLGFAY